MYPADFRREGLRIAMYRPDGPDTWRYKRGDTSERPGEAQAILG